MKTEVRKDPDSPGENRSQSRSDLSESFVNRLSLVLRIFIGYDFFVSYAQSDGAEYAKRLRQKLSERDFEVFRDADELQGGEDLPRAIRGAIRRTRRLIVIGTDDSLASPWVRDEIREFLQNKDLGSIIPIEIDEIRDQQDWFGDSEILFINDPEGLAGPSNAIVDRVATGMYRDRVARAGRRILATAGLIGLLLLVAAVIASIGFIKQRDRARNEATTAQLNRIAQHIESGRRLVVTDMEGWDSFANAAKICRDLELEPFPVALAAYLAHRGARDFSKGGLGRTPGLRIPAAEAQFPAALRAVAWDGNEAVFVQSVFGEVFRWAIEDPPVELSHQTPGGLRRQNNIGWMEVVQGEPIYATAEGQFRGLGNTRELVRAGRVRDSAGQVTIIDEKIEVFGEVKEIKFEPRKVAQASHYWAAADPQGKVRIWERRGATDRFLKEIPLGASALALDLNVNGIAIAGGGGRLLFEPFSGGPQYLAGHLGTVTTVQNSPNNNGLLLSGGTDGTSRVWDWTLGEEELRFVGPREAIHSARFSPNGRFVATVGIDGIARIWAVDAGLDRQLENSAGLDGWSIVGPENRWLIGWKGTFVRLWNLDGAKLEHELIAPFSVETASYCLNQVVVIRSKSGEARACDIEGNPSEIWRKNSLPKAPIQSTGTSPSKCVSPRAPAEWKFALEGEQITVGHSSIESPVLDIRVANIGNLTPLHSGYRMIENRESAGIFVWNLERVIHWIENREGTQRDRIESARQADLLATHER